VSPSRADRWRIAHGLTPPLCECHEEAKLWDGTTGYWRCAVKRRASKARYNASPKAKEAQAKRNARRMFVGAIYIGSV
jgi:hypothetical protein